MPAFVDRRIHQVLLTRNTEYHLRDQRCVAVRSRRTGTWLDAHAAVGCKLLATVPAGEGRALVGAPAQLGSRLLFGRGGPLTGQVLRIERPHQAVVSRYALAAA